MDEETRQNVTLGREHYNRGEFEKAEHYFRKVLEAGSAVADVHNMLGLVHHDRGELELARTCFEKALEINPRYTEAALNLAVTYNDLGRYSDAKGIYRNALGKSGGPAGIGDFVKGKIANLHAETAQAYVDAGMPPEAMHELRKAISLCPDFADLRLRLANLYRETGDLDAAGFELSEAVERKPEFVPGQVSLGLVRLEQGRQADAIAHWQKALSLEPDHRSAAMYLRMVQHPPEDADTSAPEDRDQSGNDAASTSSKGEPSS